VINDCMTVASKIDSLIHNPNDIGWSISKMSEWKAIREFVLCHPTLSKDNYENLTRGQKHFYFKRSNGQRFSKYWFDCKDNDGNRVYDTERMDKLSISIETASKPFEVSENDALLPILKTRDYLRKDFTDMQIPMTFEINDYIINPTVYKSIYKGALGEEVVKEYFAKELNKELQEITDGSKFEKFDFVMKDVPNIYIDAKSWSESTLNNNNKLISDIRKKLQSINGDGNAKAIIINIYSRSERKVQNFGDILTVPSLYTKDDKNSLVPCSNGAGEIMNFLQGNKV
jgi:hypothetical protein